MIWLLRDFDLLSVLLRGLTLSLEMVTLGGVSYQLAVALPSRAGDSALLACRRFLLRIALALAIAEMADAAVDTALLMGSSSLRFGELVSAPFFLAGAAATAAALTIALLARAGLRKVANSGVAYASVAPGVILLAAAVSVSHSASRMDHRVLLAALTAAHHLGAALWIGGLPFLLVSLKYAADAEEAKRLVRRFSPVALAGAGTLLLGGVGMAWFYLGVSTDRSLSGLYGTAYGVMLLAKIYLTLVILGLGAGNYFLVRRIESAPVALLTRLRRFGEAEIGLGLTAVLAAASMTSQPPAIDMPMDRLSIPAIAAHFRPEMPRLTSPPLAALAPATSLRHAMTDSEFSGSNAASDANDRAWSEYNHHWAGLIVLAAGMLALLSRFAGFRWARNWPAVFAGLAIFILLRADPECWPLGPRPFWGSLAYPDVLEHRLYALLILAFAAFEWGVETGRVHSRRAALVFPALCAAAGALLLTHNHGMGDMKENLLAEMSHTPIALLGATAGWGRWLELRLQERKDSRFVSYVWPICLMLVGLVLVDYRE